MAEINAKSNDFVRIEQVGGAVGMPGWMWVEAQAKAGDLERLLRDRAAEIASGGRGSVSVDLNFTCEACPVQAEGTVDGVPFYFRARWSQWRMTIGDAPTSWKPLPGQWRRSEPWGDGEYGASFMPLSDARAIILRCVEEWRAAREAAGGEG